MVTRPEPARKNGSENPLPPEASSLPGKEVAKLPPDEGRVAEVDRTELVQRMVGGDGSERDPASRPEERPEDSPRRPMRHTRTVVVSFLASALLGAVLDRLLNLALDLPVRLIAGVAGIAAATVAVVFLLVRVFPRNPAYAPLRQFLHRLRPLRKGTAIVAVFVGSMLVASQMFIGTVAWGRRVVNDPCDRRLELRVLTTPELLPALREQAELFADEQARVAGCRPVRLSVSAVSSVPDLESAFQHQWAATPGTPVLGPQPDVWIPASTETVRHMRDKGVSNLRTIGPVGTSPLVMAVPDGNAAVIGSQTGQSLPELVSAARAEELTAVRANPETSEVGLLATVALYQAHPGDRGEESSLRRDSERWMAGSTLPARDSVDLMCAVRGAQSGNGETPKIAALVPEHVLHAYNSGEPLGPGCPRAELSHGRLSAFYPQGVRTFDHPFVHVSWAGQVSWERTSMVERLHAWLASGRLGAAGLRDEHGAAAAARIAGQSDLPFPPAEPRPDPRLDRTLRQFRKARPALAVRLVVDISGSMGAGTPTQGSRLDRARRLLHAALKLLASEQSNDHVGLVSFPAWPAGPDLSHSELKRLGPTRGRDLRLLSQKIDSLVTAAGTSSPLYATITESVEFPPDTARIPTVIVLTDGGDKVSQGPPGGDHTGVSGERLSEAWLDSLVEALKSTGDSARPHLVFLTIGTPEWCQGRPIQRLGEHTRVDCHDATADDTSALISGVVGRIRTGVGP